MIKKLKLIAGNIIKESNYSLSAKKQLLNFIINEASETQIKSLILDGKIEILDEDSIDIVNQRFDNFSKKIIDEDIKIGREYLVDIIKEEYEKSDKFEDIINFIMNEASSYQILSMIVEGILPEEESNSEREIKLYNFINEAKKIPYKQAAKVSTGIGATTAGGLALTVLSKGKSPRYGAISATGALVATIIYLSYMVYKKIMKSYGKRCQTFEGDERIQCLENAKNQALKQQLKVLKNGMNKCSKSKDPSSCTEKIKNKMAKVQLKIK